LCHLFGGVHGGGSVPNHDLSQWQNEREDAAAENAAAMKRVDRPDLDGIERWLKGKTLDKPPDIITNLIAYARQLESALSEEQPKEQVNG
jgi:hypothetical protein